MNAGTHSAARRLRLCVMLLLVLWFGVTLMTRAEDTPIPRDGTIPPWITRAGGPDIASLKGGAYTEEMGGSTAAGAVPWLTYEAPICTQEGLPVPYLVRYFFGYDPNYFDGKWHSGVDMPCPVGTPIRATMAGIVSFAGWSSTGYGNLVVVQNGVYQTYYAHASEFAVSTGDVVQAGQVVALSGNTGSSTGPHLHYEVRVDGQQVDPLTIPLPGQSQGPE